MITHTTARIITYTPKTVWQGGRPACLGEFKPVENLEKQKVYRPNGSERICEHCGGTYKQGKHDSTAGFELRKYCNWTCANAARDKARNDRIELVMACLPGTKNDIVNKTGLTWAEMERIMIYMVAGKMVVSEHNGNYGRIFRKVTP